MTLSAEEEHWNLASFRMRSYFRLLSLMDGWHVVGREASVDALGQKEQASMWHATENISVTRGA